MGTNDVHSLQQQLVQDNPKGETKQLFKAHKMLRQLYIYERDIRVLEKKKYVKIKITGLRDMDKTKVVCAKHNEKTAITQY